MRSSPGPLLGLLLCGRLIIHLVRSLLPPSASHSLVASVPGARAKRREKMDKGIRNVCPEADFV